MSDDQIPAKLEPVDRVLVALVVFFSVILLGLAHWSANDGQTFQVFCGALTTFIGAFVGRMLPHKKSPPSSGGDQNS